MTYLLAPLQDRFAALDEQARLACMTEMLAHSRRPSESINALLARYEIAQRAATENKFVMSVKGFLAIPSSLQHPPRTAHAASPAT